MINLRKSILIFMVAATVALTGCNHQTVKPGEGNMGVITGSPITNNHTPSTVGLMCVGEEIKAKKQRTKRITIGEVPDLTGKYEESFGNRLTQGASNMGMSALGKMNGAVAIVERGDTGVFEFDMDLASKKILGDGGKYKLPGGQTVRYRPIVSGSVAGTDYYITGALTEMNYNIGSSGGEVDVSGWMAGMRRYTSNVAGDFRIVNSRTLEVIDTLTLQKQVVGYETKAGVFRFFGVELVDLNMGNKKDEPLQLAVRALLEEAIGILVGSVHGIDGEAIFDRVNAENPFDAEWMQNPRAVVDRVCPKVAPKVYKQVTGLDPIMPVKPKKSYRGACTSKNVCQACMNPTDLAINIKPVSGTYVQMAAFRDPNLVFKEASCLKYNYGDLFADKQFAVRADTVNGKPWKSLLVGPMEVQEANGLCAQAKDRGLDCYVRTTTIQ
jgi:curli production assembly/transport component CsgG/holdfast attachment protein HfaB